VERRVKYLRRTSRLQIVSYSKGSLSHEAMMQLFSRSICYIGFSLSDGISTSMIESMANGAVPIQTSTSCAEEWIQHGKTGFILDPTDLEGLKKALLSITQGDFDANQARLENSKVIDEKYDPDNLSNIAKEQYRIMLSLTR
jgi:glycosyltransferase involved in cell wall biosynthesis